MCSNVQRTQLQPIASQTIESQLIISFLSRKERKASALKFFYAVASQFVKCFLMPDLRARMISKSHDCSMHVYSTGNSSTLVTDFFKQSKSVADLWQGNHPIAKHSAHIHIRYTARHSHFKSSSNVYPSTLSLHNDQACFLVTNL